MDRDVQNIVRRLVSDFRYLIFQKDTPSEGRYQPSTEGFSDEQLKRLKEQVPTFYKGADNFRSTNENLIPTKLESFLSRSIAPANYIKNLKSVVDTTRGEHLVTEKNVSIDGLTYSSGGYVLVPLDTCEFCEPFRLSISIPYHLTELYKPLFMMQTEQILVRFLLNFCVEMRREPSVSVLECFYNPSVLKNLLKEGAILWRAVRIEPYLIQTKTGWSFFSYVSLGMEKRFGTLANLFRIEKDEAGSAEDRALRALLLLKLFHPQIAESVSAASLQTALQEAKVIEYKGSQYLANLASRVFGEDYQAPRSTEFRTD